MNLFISNIFLSPENFKFFKSDYRFKSENDLKLLRTYFDSVQADKFSLSDLTIELPMFTSAIPQTPKQFRLGSKKSWNKNFYDNIWQVVNQVNDEPESEVINLINRLSETGIKYCISAILEYSDAGVGFKYIVFLIKDERNKQSEIYQHYHFFICLRFEILYLPPPNHIYYQVLNFHLPQILDNKYEKKISKNIHTKDYCSRNRN